MERTVKVRRYLAFGRKLFFCVALVLADSSRLALAAPGSSPSTTVDWLKPSDGPYPQLGPAERLWISVSLQRQKVDIMNGDRRLYTMVASTGLDTPVSDQTPEGVFFIQHERGLSFFNTRIGEGARYWVSWLHHGEYLFHSVPTDRGGRVIADEALKLGQRASHGCIRLTLPDAKWIYENMPYGTKVVIGP
jgi:lipoprotein-anchoring transpeptidase ErfK/SrfK